MVFTDCESCTRPISTNPGSMQAGEYWANTWDVFRRTPSRGGHGRRAAVDFVVCFGCGGISCFFRVFFLRTHTACSKYSYIPYLVQLSKYIATGTCNGVYDAANTSSK